MGCCEQLTRRLLVPSAQHVVCMSQACAGNRSFGMRFLSTCLPTGRSCPVARLAAMRPDGHAHRLVCLRGLSSAPYCLRLIRTVQTRRAFNALSVICPKQLHHMPDVLSGGSVHTLHNVNVNERRTFLNKSKCDGTTLSSLCSAIVRKKSSKAGKTSAREDIEDEEVRVITCVGHGSSVVKRWTVNRETLDSNPTTATSKPGLYNLPHFTVHLFQMRNYLPIKLASIPGEVKYPTSGG